MRDARRTPAQTLHRRRKAAHELIIVVGIENIVLTIILALRDKIDAGKLLGKIAPRGLALDTAAIGKPPPAEIDLAYIAPIAPAPFAVQRLQAGTIGHRLLPEHTICRLPPP